MLQQEFNLQLKLFEYKQDWKSEFRYGIQYKQINNQAGQ